MTSSRPVVGALCALALLAVPTFASAAEPALVKTVNPSTQGSQADACVEYAGACYFEAEDNVHGRELWKTDGTPDGTVLVQDIRPGADGSYPRDLTVAGGRLYFSADDGAHGTELWTTDGTTTRLVADLSPGGDAYPSSLVAFDGELYFAADDGVHGHELHATDGTTVRLVADVNGDPAGSQINDLVAVGDALFFTAYTDEYRVWRFDGTTTSVVPDSPTTPGGLTRFGSKLVFSGHSPATGFEPWIAGETGGATLVEDLVPGPDSSSADGFAVVGGVAYFGAAPGSLFAYDGTTVTDLGISGLRDLVATRDRLYVTTEDADGRSLLRVSSNGTEEVGGLPADRLELVPAGTDLYIAVQTRVGDDVLYRVGPQPGANATLVTGLGHDLDYDKGDGIELAPFGGRVVFTYADATSGPELAISDGTAAGTHLLRDINRTPVDAGIREIVSAGDLAYFVPERVGGGQQLWRTDGTTPGTFPVLTAGDRISDLVGVGAALYFRVDGDTPRLWRTDGTAAGTQAIAQTDGAGALTAASGRLFFVADGRLHTLDGATPRALSPVLQDPQQLSAAGTGVVFTTSANGVWRSDGTPEGTRSLPGTEDGGPPVAVGATTFFVKDAPGRGLQLWRTDGSTPEIVEVAPGGGSTYPEGLTAVGDHLYFKAYDPATGDELYRVGASGAAELIDVTPGAGGGYPRGLIAFAGGVVFEYSTADGVALLRAGPGIDGAERVAGDADSPVVVDGRLYFARSDAAHGRELWALDASAGTPERLTDLAAGAGDGIVDRLAVGRAGGVPVFAGRADGQAQQLWRIGTPVVKDDGDEDEPATPGTPVQPPRPATPTPATPSAPTPAPAQVTAPQRSLVSVFAKPQTVTRIDGRLRVRTGLLVRCPAGRSSCTVSVTLTRAVTRGGRSTQVAAGSRTLTVRAGTSRTLPVTLLPAAARELRRAGSLAVRAQVRVQRGRTTLSRRTEAITLTAPTRR